MYSSLLALAGLFSSRSNDYHDRYFPTVHRGVDSMVFHQLATPFDFIIVGSGYAGSFLARKLSTRKCRQIRVLLLESGDLPTFDTTIPFAQIYDHKKNQWEYFTVSQRKAAKAMTNRQVRLSWGKTLGGDSVTDQGIQMPPNLGDFHRWAYLYNMNDWNYTEMKSYMFHPKENKIENNKINKMMRMERHEVLKILREPFKMDNILEPLKMVWLRAARALNFSVVDAKHQKMFNEAMSHDGMKMNAASEFLRDSNTNLLIVTNVQIDSLLYSSDGRRVVGLQLADTISNATYYVNVIKEVLLANGPVHNAQLLIQSGIGPADHLHSLEIPTLRDLPVGVRLNDRVSAHLYLKVRPEFIDKLRQQINDLPGFYQFLTNGTGILADSNIAGASLVKTGYLDTPDLMLEIRPVGIVNDTDFVRQLNYRNEIVTSMLSDSFPNGCLQLTITVLSPFSQGTMWLWKKRREEAKFTPRINPSYLSDSRDLTSLVQGARHVEALLLSPFMIALDTAIIYPEFFDCPKLTLPTSQKYWHCVMTYLATGGNHLTSTTPFGSVVDSRLRVKGIGGLRVTDQSVFPNPVSGGVASTTLTLANRAFRFIKEDHRLQC